jgi:Protein of unknown function (DUF1153)
MPGMAPDEITLVLTLAVGAGGFFAIVAALALWFLR